MAVVLLAFAHPVWALTIFRAHFNGALTSTEGQAPTVAEGVEYAPGRCGTSGIRFSEQTKLEYVSRGNISLYQGSFSVWIKPDGWRGGEDNNSRFVLNWTPLKTNKINMIGFVQNRTNSVNVHIRDASGVSLVATARPASVFQADTWVHLGASWSMFEGVLRLFVNGRMADEVKSAAPMRPGETGPNFGIGGSAGSTIGGVLDEVMISDRFFGEGEILEELRRPIAAYSE